MPGTVRMSIPASARSGTRLIPEPPEIIADVERRLAEDRVRPRRRTRSSAERGDRRGQRVDRVAPELRGGAVRGLALGRRRAPTARPCGPRAGRRWSARRRGPRRRAPARPTTARCSAPSQPVSSAAHSTSSSPPSRRRAPPPAPPPPRSRPRRPSCRSTRGRTAARRAARRTPPRSTARRRAAPCRDARSCTAPARRRASRATTLGRPGRVLVRGDLEPGGRQPLGQQRRGRPPRGRAG